MEASINAVCRGECKFELNEDGHSDWISCVRFSPNPETPFIVSAGWDKIVKVMFSLSDWVEQGLVCCVSFHMMIVYQYLLLRKQVC